MKFVKKPVVIDAVEWTGHNHREMYDFLTGTTGCVMRASGETFHIDHRAVDGGLVIKTLEGQHIASIGDWIVKGVKGEFYPCKPDIFALTYDRLLEGGE